MNATAKTHRRRPALRTIAGVLLAMSAVLALAFASPTRADETEITTQEACTPQSTLSDEALKNRLWAAGSNVADPADATGSTATTWSAVVVVPEDLCEATVSFSAYELPSGFYQPYEDQELFDNVTATYTPGRYDISVDLPTPCGWQVDLYVGGVLWPLVPNIGHPPTRQIDVAGNQTMEPCEDVVPEESGTLEVRKETNPDGAEGEFSFVASFGDAAGFALGDGASTGPIELSGSHQITEVLTAAQTADGWSLTSVTCTGDADFLADGATAHVTVDSGEVIVCTFLNTRTGGGTAPGNPTPTPKPSEGTAPPAEGTQGGNPPQELPDTAVGSATGAPAVGTAFLAMLALLGLGLTSAVAHAYRSHTD